MKGIKRFRQAIKNQQDAGEGEFRLTYAEAEEIAGEIEEEFARLSWAQGVPVPRDADGNAVPLTTKVMYDDDGGEMTIMSFTFYVDGGFWRTDPECPSVYAIDRVDLLHLHRPDSWERLEKDVRNAENGGACSYYSMETKTCSEGCPADEDPQTFCLTIVLEDVLRRAKALAGRGED